MGQTSRAAADLRYSAPVGSRYARPDAAEFPPVLPRARPGDTTIREHLTTTSTSRTTARGVRARLRVLRRRGPHQARCSSLLGDAALQQSPGEQSRASTSAGAPSLGGEIVIDGKRLPPIDVNTRGSGPLGGRGRGGADNLGRPPRRPPDALRDLAVSGSDCIEMRKAEPEEGSRSPARRHEGRQGARRT